MDPNGKNGKKRNWRSLFVLGLILGLVLLLVWWGQNPRDKGKEEVLEISQGEFMKDVEAGEVESVTIKDKVNITGVYKPRFENVPGKKFKTKLVSEADFDLTEFLRENDVDYEAKESSNWLPTILSFAFPVIFIVLIIFLFMRMSSAGGAGQARQFVGDPQMVTQVPPERFSDVGGIEEAKFELQEFVDFLKNPDKYTAMGAEIPKGALLLGPPGTGKTLLARAIAGEAGVPFFTMAGSEFVEMFVGVGASRVRGLFDRAKKHAPCIVFLDELDAVGRHRGAGLGGGHDEREQTLNQILVAMDGFQKNGGVIVIAATNRPDILDPALLRPGRFDRQIFVRPPGVEGRKRILEIHLAGKPREDDVDIEALARSLAGRTGADIKNLVNEAAIFAVRAGRAKITMQDLKKAEMKVTVGLEQKGEKRSQRDRETAAWHEAGHYLVAYLLLEVDDPDRVSIIPAGMAGGWTKVLPQEERSFWTKTFALGQIKFGLGGRVAELLKFGEESSGASNDLEKATTIAKHMVMNWGMSKKLGPRVFGRSSGPIFLGKDLRDIQDYSEEKQAVIDDEIESIIRSCETDIRKLLEENRDKLDILAEALLSREELSADEVNELFRTNSP